MTTYHVVIELPKSYVQHIVPLTLGSTAEREVTCEKLSLCSGECDHALEILTQESINSKINISMQSLATFFDQFFAVLACLRNERDHTTLMAMAKKSITVQSKESAEDKFAELFTPCTELCRKTDGTAKEGDHYRRSW